MQNGASKDPLKALTFVGRLLLLITLIVAGGVLYYVMMYVVNDLPPGRYPSALLLIPVLIGAGIFFIVGSLLLQVCRIPVWTEDVKKPEAASSEPPASGSKGGEQV